MRLTKQETETVRLCESVSAKKICAKEMVKGEITLFGINSVKILVSMPHIQEYPGKREKLA